MNPESEIVAGLEASTQKLVDKGRVLRILPYTDPILRTVSKTVLHDIMDPAFQVLLKDMEATMEANRGLGLAAIQVGVPSRVLVVRDNDGGVVKVINPVVVDVDGDELMDEGCLSFPGLYLKIRRPIEVTISYLDETGTKRTAIGDKMLARAILHEMDHLDGVVMTDRIPKLLRAGVLKKYEQDKAVYDLFRTTGSIKPKKKPTGPAFVKKTKAERKKIKAKRQAGKR